jgi:threonine aldolase
MKTIDLRSDTVTKPSPEMREAMYKAEVGDDVHGDDPTVNELERYVAELFEREASLYVPSGTMANQICLRANTNPGEELICERECHVVNYEVGGPVVHAGLLVNMITTERGMFTAEQVRENVREKSIHAPLTSIVALENTHNRHSGTILPQDEILRIRKVCDEFGLMLHLDGARIWNAHIATGKSLPELTAPFDSVSVCLSKGLGAPVGSMVIGSKEFIDICRRGRKLMGGGMRQAGIIAAGGLYAVQSNIPRLADDHANARYLAESLSELDVFEIDISRVETNIVAINLTGGETAQSIVPKLKLVGVWAVPFGPKRIRMATHLDVTREDCEDAVERVKKVFG